MSSASRCFPVLPGGTENGCFRASGALTTEGTTAALEKEAPAATGAARRPGSTQPTTQEARGVRVNP